MSLRSASGTKSLTRGVRLSVRLPRRIVPICVTEPMGLPVPRRVCSTPARKVDATAPRPTSRTPSLPVAGSISCGWGAVKSLASKITPLCRARAMSGPCHCAGLRTELKLPSLHLEPQSGFDRQLYAVDVSHALEEEVDLYCFDFTRGWV